MNKLVPAALFAALFISAFAMGVYAQSGGTTEITVQRADNRNIYQGFRLRIYIDGRAQLNLTNGASGKITVPRGDHTIHAELYTLTTAKVQFTAGSSPITFVVTPQLTGLKIEKRGGDLSSSETNTAAAVERLENVFQPSGSPPAGSANPAAPSPADTSVEASLARAAGTIMSRVQQDSKMAIVYVTAADGEISEFIAGELEFILVDNGFTLIDRSELDRIRREQSFQMSGEVDDTQAVSIGKIAGADVIITGSVTGTGSLRRLRLRALSTESGQVLAAASERF
jgi:hypothetical protein